ncbi:hypothetical protein ACOYR1_06000 [Thalassotalea piscium]
MKETNSNNESEVALGAMIWIAIGAMLYYFGVFDEYIAKYQKEAEVNKQHINQLQQKIKTSTSIKEKLTYIERKVNDSCEDFATKLHKNKHFEIAQRTSVESFTLTSLQKKGSNLTPFRGCEVAGINLTDKKNTNALIMQCETAGPNYLSKGVTISCLLDANLQPKKIHILNAKLTHVLSGLGDVGNKHIPSISKFGNMLGQAVTGNVKFKIYKDQYIELSSPTNFVQGLTNLVFMQELVNVNQEKLRKYQAELKLYQDKNSWF